MIMISRSIDHMGTSKIGLWKENNPYIMKISKFLPGLVQFIFDFLKINVTKIIIVY